MLAVVSYWTKHRVQLNSNDETESSKACEKQQLESYQLNDSAFDGFPERAVSVMIWFWQQ